MAKENIRQFIEADTLRDIISDRYTAPEVVERLRLTTDEVLDNYLSDVYNKIQEFDEVLYELGLDYYGDPIEAEES
jgi:hypothetical protein